MSDHLTQIARHLALLIQECLAPAPASADPAVTVLLNQILKGQQTMSDNLTSKVDALVAAEKSLESRVNDKLASVEAARDAAVADLTTTKAALATATAQLAALPQDTSAQETALQAEADRIDGVITSLNAVDAAPVVAQPAPVADPIPAPAADPAPVAAALTPDPAAPVVTAPTADQSAPSADTTQPTA